MCTTQCSSFLMECSLGNSRIYILRYRIVNTRRFSIHYINFVKKTLPHLSLILLCYIFIAGAALVVNLKKKLCGRKWKKKIYRFGDLSIPIHMYTPFNYIDMLMQLADTLLGRHAYWIHLFILTTGRLHLKSDLQSISCWWQDILGCVYNTTFDVIIY